MAIYQKIRDDLSLKAYEAYSSSFLFTSDPKKPIRQENDVPAISKKITEAKVCFVEATRLITTRNNNVYPFITTKNEPMAALPIFNAIRFDDKCESKCSLKNVVNNMALWLTTLVKKMQNCSILILDFSRKNDTAPKCDLEDNTDDEHLYSRSDLANGTNKLYAKIAKHVLSGFKKVVFKLETDGNPIKFNKPLRIITHFGGSHLTMSVITIFRKPDSSLDITETPTFYATPNMILDSQWMMRYVNTSDTEAFFCDVMSLEEMKKWDNLLFFASENIGMSQLMRFIIEDMNKKTLTLISFLEDGNTLVIDYRSLKNLLLTHLVVSKGLKGTTGQLVTDLYMIERIAKYYNTLENAIKAYAFVRNESSEGAAGTNVATQNITPILTIEWRTNNVTFDDEKFPLLCQKIIDDESESFAIGKNLPMVCFMADMDFLMSPPMPLKDFGDVYHRKSIYDEATTNFRMWMIVQLAMSASLKGEIQLKMGSDITFITIPIVLMLILQKVKMMYGDGIRTLSDIMNYIRNSSEEEAVRAREILDNEFNDDIITSNMEKYKNDRPNIIGPDGVARPIPSEVPETPEYALDEIYQMGVESIDQYQVLENIFTTYETKLYRKFKKGRRQPIDKVLSYSPKVIEMFAPFIYEMNKRRIQKLVAEGLIRIDGDMLELSQDIIPEGTETQGLVSRDIVPKKRETLGQELKQEIYYQVLRKHPTVWEYWKGPNTRIRENFFQQQLSYLATTFVTPTPSSGINIVDESKLTSARKVHQLYTWNEFPLTIQTSVIASLSNTNFVDQDNTLWVILKHIVNEFTESVPAETPDDNYLYQFVVADGGIIVPSVNNRYMWNSSRPKQEILAANFSVFIPIILNGLFCHPLPLSWNHPDASLPVSPDVFPYLETEWINEISKSRMFTDRGNYSIFDMYMLLSTLNRLSGAGNSASTDDWFTLYLVLYNCIYFIDPSELEQGNLFTTTAQKSAPNLGKIDHVYSAVRPIITDIDKFHKFLESFGNLGEPGALLVHIGLRIKRCFIGEGSTTANIVDFITRFLEYMNEIQIDLCHRNKEDYRNCIEFMFDLYQPRFNLSPSDPGILFCRLYEIDKEHTKVRQEFPAASVYGIDFQGLRLTLDNFSSVKGAIPPSGSYQIYDPIEEKTYYTLGWDCGEYLNKKSVAGPTKLIDEINDDNLNALYNQMEIEAAYWLMNAPKFRAAVHARSKGVTWNGARWAVWLTKVYQSGSTDVIADINLAVAFGSRFKIFTIDSKSDTTPVGDLFTREFGITYTVDTENFYNVSFNNLNYIHTDLPTEHQQAFLSRLSATSKTKSGKYAGVAGKGDGLNAYTPSRARVDKGEDEFQTAEREQGGSIKEDIDWGYTPWYTVENYTDFITAPGGYRNTFKASRNQVYVYLPRSLDRQFLIPPENQLVRFEHWQEAVPTYQPYHGENMKTNYQETINSDPSQIRLLETVTYEAFISVNCDILNTTNPRVRGPVSTEMVEVIKHVTGQLPLFYGVNYVFIAYKTARRLYYKYIPGTNRLVEVTKETVQADTGLNRQSGYYYVMRPSDKYALSRLVLQGVFGNKCMRTELYYLFTNAFQFNPPPRKDDLRVICSLMKDYQDFYIARFNRMYSICKAYVINQIKSDTLAEAYGEIYRMFLDPDYAQNVRGYKGISGITGQPNFEWEEATDNVLEHHKYGFYGRDAYLMISFRQSEYFVISQCSSEIIPSDIDDAYNLSEQLHTNHISPMAGIAKWPVGSACILPMDIWHMVNRHIGISIYSQENDNYGPLDDAAISDLRRFVYQTQLAISSYVVGRRMDFALFLYLGNVSPKIEAYKIFIKYEMDHVFAIKSKKFYKEVIGILWPTGIRQSLQPPDWKRIDFFMRAIEASYSGFMYVTAMYDVDTLIASIRTGSVIEKYALGADIAAEAVNDIRDFAGDLVYITNKLQAEAAEKALKTTGSSNAEVRAELSNMPKQVTVIRKYVKDGTRVYPVTSLDYSKYGIRIPMGTIDDDTPWERIKNMLTSDQLQLFSNDEDQFDSKAKELQEGLTNGKYRGAKAVQKRATLDKMIMRLQHGRVIQAYFIENRNSVPEDDTDLLNTMYKLDQELPGGRADRPKRRTRAAEQPSNKDQCRQEYEIRKKANEHLEGYGLKLVYNGKYSTVNKEGKIPKKTSLNKYQDGVTLYISDSKLDSYKPLTKDTLLESILIAYTFTVTPPNEREELPHYMKYNTLQEIEILYAEVPSVVIENPGGDPEAETLLDRLELGVLDKLFTSNPTSNFSKAKEFFMASVSEAVDVNMNLLEFLCRGSNVIFRNSAEVISKRYGTEKYINIALFGVEGANGKVIYTFEPLFEPPDASRQFYIDPEKNRELMRAQREREIEAEAKRQAEEDSRFLENAAKGVADMYPPS